MGQFPETTLNELKSEKVPLVGDIPLIGHLPSSESINTAAPPANNSVGGHTYTYGLYKYQETQADNLVQDGKLSL